MREHPVIGERILRAIPGLGGVARIVRHEHERFDGGGYPDGLAGDEIPIGSRIILACDAYHAMTSDRPYRKAMAHAEAIRELAASAGTQFDPQVTEHADRLPLRQPPARRRADRGRGAGRRGLSAAVSGSGPSVRSSALRAPHSRVRSARS